MVSHPTGSRSCFMFAFSFCFYINQISLGIIWRNILRSWRLLRAVQAAGIFTGQVPSLHEIYRFKYITFSERTIIFLCKLCNFSSVGLNLLDCAALTSSLGQHYGSLLSGTFARKPSSPADHIVSLLSFSWPSIYLFTFFF